jgi:ABC-2 type transport system ATP-binding protein
MQQVTERRTVEIQLLSDRNVAAVAQYISKVLGPDAEVTQSPAESMVRFTTGKDEKAMAQLLAGLVAGKAPIAQFREVQQDLEDAFLSVTKPRESVGEAGSAAPAPVASQAGEA